ncbi:ISL3 family transposase [Bacteroides uniformis]|uniref:ISL3 family transposase n=1 Tax=Bacteroides uniformis TaxID=820 RepID=UPI002165D944|nr:ISL3 family transposase [Bacteroides uniformis]MCS2724484.1 ISL3 family transposase [Bacteroides uniformis]
MSTHQHSIYERRLLDLPISGKKVIIIMQIRKYRCKNPKCERKIFAEQNECIAKRYSRLTNRAIKLLQNVLVEMSSQKAALVTSQFCMEQSSSTCLRIVKNMLIPQPDSLTVIGIDDWAKRKGVCYGTIIVNAETNRPIDLLDSRENEAVSSWLKNHPSIKLVTRDRASSYANAICTGLPHAGQIADKFHIMKNLSDYITVDIQKQYSQIKQTFLSKQEQPIRKMEQEKYKPEKDNMPLSILLERMKEARRISSRTKEAFKEVHRLARLGISQRGIARMLHMHRNTVSRYLDMKEPMPRQSHRLNDYESFIHLIREYYNQGLSMTKIHQMITKQGFHGTQTAFFEWFHIVFPKYQSARGRVKVKETQILNNSIDTRMNLLSPSRLAIHTVNPEWGIFKKTGECSSAHILAEQVVASSSMLKEMREAYLSFQEVLNSGIVSELHKWISTHKKTSLKCLKSFINGLNKDFSAVCNAIKYKWTNGLVEGEVNRLKNKKREMYGRGSFQLLRRKVVLSVTG